ncbi:MAG: ABC transporter permease [Polyangiaceae bacterium]
MTRIRHGGGGVHLWLWFAPLVLLTVSAGTLALSNRTPARLELPRTFAGPMPSHPLGFGEGGLDLGAFAGHACLRVLVLALTVAGVSCAIGSFIGVIAAQRRNIVEHVIVRACDLVQAFPSFLLALAVLSAVAVPERWHLAIVFSLLGWAPFARLTHALARGLFRSEFVLAARAFGASRLHVGWFHVVPHLVGPLAVQMGASAAGVVLGEASLGFIGLGPSDGISLGALLEQGTAAMFREPRVLLVASSTIALTSGALQLASEGLRAILILELSSVKATMLFAWVASGGGSRESSSRKQANGHCAKYRSGGLASIGHPDHAWSTT